MPAWPTALPEWNRDITTTPQDAVVRTPMSAGPAKTRGRFSAVSVFFKASMFLNEDERIVFENFFVSIGRGATSFTMTNEQSPDGTAGTFLIIPPPSYMRCPCDAGGPDPIGHAALTMATLQLEKLP